MLRRSGKQQKQQRREKVHEATLRGKGTGQARRTIAVGADRVKKT